MTDQVAKTDIIQSIERCFAVLEAFETVPPDETSTSRLAWETKLPRPVVRRILLTLTSLGYARPAGPFWRLEPTLLRFSSLYLDTSPLVSASRRHVDELQRETGETIVVSERVGLLARIVYAAHADHFLAIQADTGQPLPLHATSPGQVMLAWQGVPAKLPLIRYTPQTITKRDSLLSLLEEVRAAGFSICCEQLERGLIDAAVPVLDPGGFFLGSLSLATSAGRLSRADVADSVVPALRETALRITAELNTANRQH